MLISFAAENYRSIREEVELQMTAVNYYKENTASLIDAELPGLIGIKFLRAAAFYGPNASGKTTVWRAFKLMREMVLTSASQHVNLSLSYEPFLLDDKTQNEPTKLRVTFMARDKVRYEYSFAFTANAVIEENLVAYPKGRKQAWFTRQHTNKVSTIKGSAYVRVPKSVKELLNDNVLLLSLLANLSKVEAYEAVRPIIDWFANGVDVYSRAPEQVNDFPHSGEIINNEIGTNFQRNYIQGMMRKADIGITSAKVEKQPVPEFLRPIMEKLTDVDFDQEREFKIVVFQHENKKKKVSLEFGNESDGTQQLFGLSGHIAEALEKGSLLFVDEVDASLHSILVAEVIKTFMNSSTNPNGAQLVFTAHNPCLLQGNLLRRDQIWFTEKNNDGATELYPLSNFSPRKDESVATGYLVGRYSAIPVVPACFGWDCKCTQI